MYSRSLFKPLLCCCLSLRGSLCFYHAPVSTAKATRLSMKIIGHKASQSSHCVCPCYFLRTVSHLSVALDDRLGRTSLSGHPASPMSSLPLVPHVFFALQLTYRADPLLLEGSNRITMCFFCGWLCMGQDESGRGRSLYFSANCLERAKPGLFVQDIGWKL